MADLQPFYLSIVGSLPDSERSRISRAFHDEIGQNLAILKLRLSELLINRPTERKEILAIIDDTMETMRRLVFDIRPPDIDDSGVVPVLQSKINYFKRDTQMKVRLIVEPKNLKVPSPLDMGIFRIVQEALCNIIKHAGATSVIVALKQPTKDTVVVEISDNGRGITQSEIKTRGSLGIPSMKTRTALLNGRIQFSGKPGKGTIVRASFPLKAEIRERQSRRKLSDETSSVS